VPEKKPRCLIRWEFIHVAELFDTKEAVEGTADFWPMAA
jgi:hypothetical protein